MSGLVYSPDPTLIVNELLTFVCSATNNSSWENIRDIAGEFYSAEQISEASRILFQHVGEFVPSNRPSTRVTDSNGHLKNISLVIAKLISEETPIPVKFCAVDVSQLPRVKPEHINKESMASEIAVLKEQMKDMMNIVSNNTSTLNSIQANNTFAARVAAPSAASVFSHLSQSSYPRVTQPVSQAIINSNNQGNGTVNTVRAEQFPSAVTAASSTLSNEIWLQTKNERRRQMRNKVKLVEENGRVMVGSASGGTVAASFPSKIVHVIICDP